MHSAQTHSGLTSGFSSFSRISTSNLRLVRLNPRSPSFTKICSSNPRSLVRSMVRSLRIFSNLRLLVRSLRFFLVTSVYSLITQVTT